MAKMKNPLRAWFDSTGTLQREAVAKLDISQSFLTSLLSERPPWPSRALLAKIIDMTGGAVTADQWVRLPDPPTRAEIDEIAATRREVQREVEERLAARRAAAEPAPVRRRRA